MKKNTFIASLIFLFVFCTAGAYAQTTEKIERSETQIEQEKQLREKIEKEKEVPLIEEQLPAPSAIPLKAEEKVLIQKITVSGAFLLSESEVNDIIEPYKNRELALKDMQEICDLITDAYRKKGYITSRAYLPPQKIENNSLEIKVIEGKTGEIEIKGNRFFRASALKRYIHLDKAQPFNYRVLSANLSKINEHPDRTAKAVLVPGKAPGTTDILVEIKDRLPLHAELGWDNFGSRYIRKNHYTSRFSHNNLLGFDDIFSFQYQIADAVDYQLISLSYLLPVTEKASIGFYGAHSKLALGRELRDVMARGKSKMYSMYGTYDLIGTENTSLVLNYGFDYKDSFNFQMGNEQSRDRLRIGKIGFDLDISDNLGGTRGRTIFSPEMDFGFSRIMGGLHAKDSHATRTGAGGKFIKNTFNIFRLQGMPFSSTLLWKNQIQTSPYVLTTTEQFQLGGIANVRGYPVAEYSGDQGYAMTWEWMFPFYGVPKDFLVPFTQTKLYQALKLVGFYDWGTTRLHNPQAGEKKSETLRGAGCGVRFNLPENFSVHADFAWPLSKTPSDGKHFHPWVQIAKKF